MKKISLIICSFALVFLAGCNTSTDLLKKHTSAASLTPTTPMDLVPVRTNEGFANDLCVVSINETPAPVEEVVTQQQSGPDSSRSGYPAELMLLDISNSETLYGYNVFEAMPPASLTKLLTALVALKYGSFDEQVTITEEMMIDFEDAQVCGFMPGDVVSMDQLFKGLLIYSGNDAASAIAIQISGDLDSFSQLLNQEAYNIGAVDTHFTNPHGLDSNGHVTTAYDLYLIFNECLKYERFVETIAEPGFTLTYSSNGETVYKECDSTNWYLLNKVDSTDGKVPPEGITPIGGKTGTTGEAGNCLLLYAKDAQDHNYISVIMGSDGYEALYEQTNNLLSYINKK